MDQVQPSQVIRFSASGLLHVAEAAAHLRQHFFAAAEAGADLDLPPVFVPVFKLELNPILKCFVSTEVVES